MIETCRLKNVAIFFKTIISFVLSRKIINIKICVFIFLWLNRIADLARKGA